MVTIVKKLVIFCLVLAGIAEAKTVNVYFSEVKSIDRNNIITVVKNGKERLIRLAYLRTPIKGEFKNNAINTYLTDELLNKWIRVNELPGTGRAKVYRAVVRDDNQKLVNVKVASRGLGIPVQLERPPLSIINAAKIAKDKGLGIWENKKQFSKDMEDSDGKVFLSILEDAKETLTSQNDENLQIFIGNKKERTFTPLKCIKTLDPKQMVIFATKYVGLNRKYTFIPCPSKKAQQ